MAAESTNAGADRPASSSTRTLLTCPIRGPLNASNLAADGLTTTEEARRIDFIHYLLARGYPGDAIHVETVIVSGLGERGRSKLRADVMVYDRPKAEVLKLPAKDRLDHALLVAEIKRDSKSRGSGIEFQLEPAMRLIPGMGVLGVYWDDVNRLLLHKSVVRRGGSEVLEVGKDSLANLPAYGHVYKSKPITLGTLVPAENLLSTLQGLANVMRSHGVNDEHLRYKETVKLLLARYIDEKEASARKSGELSLQVLDGADGGFRQRVDGVYAAAGRRYSKATTLFGRDPSSELSDEALRDCVRTIQGVNLSSANSDVMQQVFMSFVPAVFKKSLDQYFTPITLVEAMVEMVGIGPTDKIADPAMGTADFLTAAMASRIAAGDDDAPQRIFGVDKDPRAFDLAVINMILHRDGQTGLLCDDSLEKHALWSEEMDVVLCNPPFGARTLEKRRAVLRNYDLGHVWTWDPKRSEWRKTREVAEKQQLGLLFLERCYKLLAAGGRLAIIVPEGYLCTPSYGYVRQWILEHFQVLAVTELPRRIFLKSDADLRSNVLVARKLDQPGRPDVSYPIYTGLVRKVGYKLAKGFPEIARRDPESGLELRNQANELVLDTDFDRVRHGFQAFMQDTVGGTKLPSGWQGATSDDVFGNIALDLKPRRLSPKALKNVRDIRAGDHVRLGDIAEVVTATVDLLGSSAGAAAFRRPVEGMDIRAIEGTVVPQEAERCWSIADRKSQHMYELRDRDIVVGLVRPERRNIGLLLDTDGGVVGAPDGIAVVRPLEATAADYPVGWLFSVLRSEVCRLQFWTESGGTSYGKLTREHILDVLIPIPPLEERLAVDATVRSWEKAARDSTTHWNQIGSDADRRPILNSPLFGLEDDETGSDEEDG